MYVEKQLIIVADGGNNNNINKRNMASWFLN